MAEGESGNILLHSCELEYLKLSPSAKQRTVTIELLTKAGRGILRILPTTAKEKVEDIFTEKIGAATIIKLEQKYLIGRKPVPRNALILFWKQSVASEEWNHLIIVDKERPAQFNCVEQLKSKLTGLCSISSYPLSTDVDSGATSDLQFTRSYIAIVPSDGQQHLEVAGVAEFVTIISSEFLFIKSTDQIWIIEEESPIYDSLSAFNVITLKTFSGKLLRYVVSDVSTLGRIKADFPSKHLQPLPPLPTATCGPPPSINDTPFWLLEDIPRTPSIYDSSSQYQTETYTSYNYAQRRRRTLEGFQREPSVRFRMFEDSVEIKPAMLELSSRTSHHEHLYDIPRLSAMIDYPVMVTMPDDVPITTRPFPQDNVESTFADFLKKILRNTFQPELEEACPIGMMKEERVKFCYRLDLVEYDVLTGPCWKSFASNIMDLNNEDLRMFDEFSCKYQCQVVEVILDHWYKLHSLGSARCLYSATKPSIITALRELNRYALIHEMGWEND